MVEDLAGHTGPATPDGLYASPPPWDIGRPQPAFLTLAEAGRLRGRVLDVGCGTGEHALLAAQLGLQATGVDLAGNALRTAEHKAGDRGLHARFLQFDALKLAELGESFDTILDCGLFHILAGEQRAAYVTSLHSALSPGGQYYLLGFSDQHHGPFGRHRLTRQDITAAFADRWRLDTIEPASIDITAAPYAVAAWFAAATRI
ncbi:class I SAM-dependent methyltransferase [Actinoplanes sp. NPDC051513]|uniref:class I SAM-dependent methyltransferase n=1 Tax=Actinoplanes sp. NPDC051513 TaxID=3363908 RepID=UPI00379F4C10